MTQREREKGCACIRLNQEQNVTLQKYIFLHLSCVYYGILQKIYKLEFMK